MNRPNYLPSTVLGIDPGKTGAMAVFELQGGDYRLEDCVDFNEKEIISYLHDLTGDTEAFLENVHAAPGQGVVSMFSFGENFGWWRGVLSAVDIPVTLVAPQSWSPRMLGGNPKYRSSNKKEISLEEARKKFTPSFFCRKKDNGRADASWIGAYAIQYILGGSV